MGWIEDRSLGELRSVLTEYQEAGTLNISKPELFSFSTPLEIEIVGFDLERLKQLGDEPAAILSAEDRFTDVRSNLEQGYPEIRIDFDQERISRLGLNVRQVSDQVVRQVRGEVPTRYTLGDRRIDIRVRNAEGFRQSVDDIRQMVINPGSARPIRLQSVATVDLGEGPAEIQRSEQERAAVISANLAYGDLASAAERAEVLLADMRLPPGFRFARGGTKR